MITLPTTNCPLSAAIRLRSSKAHFRVLQLLTEQPDINQRELAQRLGVSVGKTNYLIKALIEKGWIKIGNFRRSDDKLRKIAYFLTSAGIRQRIRLTHGYLARKEAEYEALKAEIAALCDKWNRPVERRASHE